MLVVVALVGLLALVAQRRYLTSIADVPGPFLASISRVWHLWRIIKGDIDQQCIALHERYGAYGCLDLQNLLDDNDRLFRPHQP